jgi:hypothetical protein
MRMLEQVIRACPEDLWCANPHGQPIWKRVLHALESADFHFNDFGRYLFSDIVGMVSPEFDCKDTRVLSQDEMLRYFGKVKEKCTIAFETLDDQRLQTISPAGQGITYLDTIIQQIRHLSLNAGRCAEALAASGSNCVTWEGYNE